MKSFLNESIQRFHVVQVATMKVYMVSRVIRLAKTYSGIRNAEDCRNQREKYK